MQVLKFGGSSVANAENINKVISIVLDSIKREPTILVVSALGGITDSLLHAGKLAAEADEQYKVLIKEMETRRQTSRPFETRQQTTF